MGCGGRVASPLVHDKGYYHSYTEGADAPKAGQRWHRAQRGAVVPAVQREGPEPRPDAVPHFRPKTLYVVKL